MRGCYIDNVQLKIWSNLSFGAFIKPVKQVNKKIFNFKTWHFWKLFCCFVCSVVDYVARTTIYKYIFVLRQYPFHDGILFPYIHCCVVQAKATQFSQSTLFSLKMESMLLKSASAVPSCPHIEELSRDFSFVIIKQMN